MVVYYVNKVSEYLVDYHYPIKHGDICMLYDGEVVKTIYIDGETSSDSIWRDFKFIDSKSLRSYKFPISDCIICAPLYSKKAIGNNILLTQLIKECTGEWLLDFLNGTSAILSGISDYWDLKILKRLVGDDDIKVVYENEEILSQFFDGTEISNPELSKKVDNETNADIDSLSAKKYTAGFSIEALGSIEDFIDKRSYNILLDVLSGESLPTIASKYEITRERTRQIVVNTIRLSKTFFLEQRKELTQKRIENTKLNAQIQLLQEENKSLKAQLDKLGSKYKDSSVEYLTDDLAELLETPLRDISLPIRAGNALKLMEISKFADIPQITNESQVMSVRNTGRKTVYDIQRMLKDFRLTFGMTYQEVIEVLKENDWYKAQRKWIKSKSILTDSSLLKDSATPTPASNDLLEIKKLKDNEENYTIKNYEECSSPKKEFHLDKLNNLDTQSRKGQSWTPEEEERMKSLFQRGVNFSTIADTLKRTEVAIKLRLAKLGLIDYQYSKEENNVSPSNDLQLVDFAYSSIAVTGKVKKYEDDLKAMGGVLRVSIRYGSIWLFSEKCRSKLERYIKGDRSVVHDTKDVNKM